MSLIPFHNVSKYWAATLETAMDNSQTTLDLSSSGSSGSPEVPFYLDVDSEIMECTLISIDTPSGGIDRLTVARGALGTSPSSHLVNSIVQHHAYAEQVTELQVRMGVTQTMIADMLSRKDGVQRIADGTALKVVATSPASMQVEVNIGSGMVSLQILSLFTITTSVVILDPISNDRIDIVQIDRSGTISIKTGSENPSPTAPSVDSDNLKLADIYLRPGELTIENTDDSTNGHIIDQRVYL